MDEIKIGLIAGAAVDIIAILVDEMDVEINIGLIAGRDIELITGTDASGLITGLMAETEAGFGAGLITETGADIIEIIYVLQNIIENKR